MDALTQLRTISEELDEHAQRLSKRAADLRASVKNGEIKSPQELAALIAESFDEQVNTGLDFQRELVVRVAEALAEVGDGGGAEVGLEAEDADLILGVLGEYRALLESGLNTLPAETSRADRAAWQGKLDKCKQVITRVEELTFDDEDGPGDEEEDDDAEDGAEAN